LAFDKELDFSKRKRKRAAGIRLYKFGTCLSTGMKKKRAAELIGNIRLAFLSDEIKLSAN